jgi:hypothetical protein
VTAECGVSAVIVVGVEPVGQGGAASGLAGVGLGVGPFVGQGAAASSWHERPIPDRKYFPSTGRILLADGLCLPRSVVETDHAAALPISPPLAEGG